MGKYKFSSGREMYETLNDTFDYDAAGLFSPADCDWDNPPRLCYGCKFERICTPPPEEKEGDESDTAC